MSGMALFRIFLLLMVSALCAMGQDTTGASRKDVFSVIASDTVPEIYNPYDTVKYTSFKWKKPKKKVFYGQKTKKGFTKKGEGNRQVTEVFYILKKWEEPNPYVPEIWVWDLSDGKVKSLTEIDPDKKINYRLLHGPYKRSRGDEVLEDGIFFKGTKHGRWETFDKNGTLITKEKFYKGWPKESQITYYDFNRTKIREMVPYLNGAKHGTYYYFTEKGNLLIKGQYQYGISVGIWVEYWPDTKRRKKETQHAQSYESPDFQPVVLKEWNEKGLLIFVNGAEIPKEDQQKEDPIKKRLKRGR